jgi:hypothetical protein
VGLGLGIGIAPRAATAANGSKPRVPVVWSEAACATVIDRSTTTTVHFEYSVPFEDLGPRTDDEVEDSRTHQFFAFARLDYFAVSTAQRLPPWISEVDITRAAMVDPQVVPEQIEPEDVLQTTSRFSATDWLRITDDDARVPISNAQAELGVDWDLSAVAPGTWTIWGYTWEPLINVWVPRPGFVKIIEDASQADAAGPSIALLQDTSEVTVGEPFPVLGCADVPDGSTVSVDWGLVDGPVEPMWQPLLVDEPIASGALAIEVTLPAEAASSRPGQTRVRLRATVTDPSGNAHVAYSFGAYEVDEAPPQSNEGCGCSGARDRAQPRDRALLVIPVLLLVGRRRRAARGQSGARNHACTRSA